MLECFVFMLAGALVFASGIAFEKLSCIREEEMETPTETAEELSEEMLKQWEALLGYDGNEREDEDENI